MTINVCPRCDRRYIASKFNTDYVHSCDSGDKTLDNEDIVVIGNWTDYSGSGGVSSSHLGTAGTQNELLGTEAGIKGANFDGVTNRGASSSTHRQRQHLEFIPNVHPARPTED